MTTIAILGTKYTGTSADFPVAPSSPDGRIVQVSGSTTIPAATVADAYVMGFPFVAGTRFIADNASFHFGDLDTGTDVTADIGVVYADDTADVPTLFRSLTSVPQTGGFVTLTNSGWMNLVAPANGWVVARIKAAPTTTAGNFTFSAGIYV